VERVVVGIGMKVTVRSLADLGEDVVLAPERWLATEEQVEHADSVPLSDLVVERREKAPEDGVLIFDTTHAKDGLLDVFGAMRSPPSSKSAKKTAQAGDLIVSRLRPYLRQIAFVHPRALDAIEEGGRRTLALSTEFYVLASANPSAGTSGESLAYLLPFLLSDRVQALLAAAQEGGHHPRVPRSTLLAIRVPKTLVENRHASSKDVSAKLTALYSATNAYHQSLLGKNLGR